MKRGRPMRSNIRQNISEILFILGEAYAYQIYKIYKNLFPKCTMRSIYYNLKRGTELNIYKISKVEKETGEYSWGVTAEKTYYALGPKATPTLNEKVKKYIDSLNNENNKN